MAQHGIAICGQIIYPFFCNDAEIFSVCFCRQPVMIFRSLFFPVSRCIYGLRRGGSEAYIEPHSRAALLVCDHSRVHREIGNDAVFRTHRRSFTRPTSADLI